MMMKRIILAAIILTNLFRAEVSFAAFDDVGRGARAPGMADVFVGIADDANAQHYNPAGLVQIPEAQVTTEFGQLLNGTNDNSTLRTSYLALAYPLNIRMGGTLGLAIHNFRFSNLFDERTISMSYGRQFDIHPFGTKGTWLGGVTLKQFHREFKPDRYTENALNDTGSASGTFDPLFRNSGFTSTAYSADLGTLYRFGRHNRYSMGLVMTNINQPSVSLNDTGDSIPTETKLGLSYRPNWGILAVELNRAKRISGSADNEVGLALERSFKTKKIGSFAARGGYAAGSRGLRVATLGGSYYLGRAELDYALRIPMGNLSDLQSSHRVGLAFGLGAIRAKGFAESYLLKDVDLISAFAHDPTAAYVLLNRMTKDRGTNNYDRMVMLQLLIRKYPIDNPGLYDIRNELSTRLRQFNAELMEWNEIKNILLKRIKVKDQTQAALALDLLSQGKTSEAISRMSILDVDTIQSDTISTLMTIGRAELAAQEYRRESIRSTIDQVRLILEIIPRDDVVRRAYNYLLGLLNQQEDPFQTRENLRKQPTVLDRDQELSAPKSVQDSGRENKLSEYEAMVRAYGESLGYFYKRKSERASLVEQKHLLQQIIHVYEPLGMDVATVKNELARINEQLNQKTSPAKPTVIKPVAPKPESKPTPKPVATPVQPVAQPEPVKPAVQPAPVKPVLESKPEPVKEDVPQTETEYKKELKKSWRYYNKAIRLGISKHERIEILKSMLRKFGESEAEQINKELKRIREKLD